jgi:DNA-directed RNA polymerase subunit F
MLTVVPDPSPNNQFCLRHSSFCLPDIQQLDSEQDFSEAFLKGSHILVHYLKLIESAIIDSSGFLEEVSDLVSLGLFRKLQYHYRSAVLLEIHHDQVGSQFLFEQLRESAITLAYLLEEADGKLFAEYAEASAQQVLSLLQQTEEQVQQFPEQESLLKLKEKLEQVASQQKNNPTALKKFSLWGAEQANSTIKREAILKLQVLQDPARHLLAQVIPASWLDVHLHYADLHLAKVRLEPRTNFSDLSNAAYLCLHVSQIVLVQVVNYSTEEHAYLQEDLNTLFLWHNAIHKACSV